MFDLSSIAYNSEHPTLITIVFTVLFTVFCASIIVFTYDKTTREINRSPNFMQALVLMAPVSAMVMQAIGDSLARGLGMLGALAIIRYRTTLRDPRNMVFMFASIAAGIGCGVFGFTIAFVGTIAFCLMAFLMRYSPFSPKQNLIGSLVIRLPQEATQMPDVERLLNQYCQGFKVVRYRVYTSKKEVPRFEIEYHVKLKNEWEGAPLMRDLQALPEVVSVRLSFADSPGVI
ncbi:MAG: DUF4956 domain-containing protein [Bacteroidetes bacterium]|nr:MAG: DUF4956 domain-containing protein [Bacteroidota bacterium]